MHNTDKFLKNWCSVPWGHVALRPEGVINPCCYSNRNMGSLKDATFEEIWNGPEYKKLRLELLNNQRPKGCEKCFYQEDIGISSLRQNSNKKIWAKDVLRFMDRNTKVDGSLVSTNLYDVDLRVTNKCNMACIMCSPEFSSKWSTELKQDKKFLTVFKDNKKFIDKHLGSLKNIYFAGGEPLIMDEHWYILDKLKEHNKNNPIDLRYNTNMSVLRYKNYYIKDYWENWNGKVVIGMSIDATDEQFDYIRYGIKWEQVKSNIIEISKYKNIDMMVNPTIGFYNVFYLHNVIEFFEKLGLDPFHISLNAVVGEFGLQNAPEKLKQDAAKYLDTLAGRASKLVWLKSLCFKQPDSNEENKFANDKITGIDTRRKTDFFKAFPIIQKYF